MDIDFTPNADSLYIPPHVYRPIQRCLSCQSVYLNETHCESCGKAINFDLLGMPFSFKSFYRIKERYVQGFSLLEKLFPILENKNSHQALSYQRNLLKRFKDIIYTFSKPNLISDLHRRWFFIEAKEIVLELFDYQIQASEFKKIILDFESEDLVLTELIHFIDIESNVLRPQIDWKQSILDYKISGVLRIEFLLKFFLITTAVCYAAVQFRYLFRY